MPWEREVRRAAEASQTDTAAAAQGARAQQAAQAARALVGPREWGAQRAQRVNGEQEALRAPVRTQEAA